MAIEVPVIEKKPAKPAEDPRKQAKRQAKIEAELLELHARLEELAAQLSDPELYADYEKVKKVGEEMERVQERIQDNESELRG
ncbi:MAG: hypothetical protein HY549_02465 [Elusimicrobia bacterium]|nr:hypothetical protein [Elusimicrobiota bacterium]